MSSGIFTIRKDGTLVEMIQTDYDSENVLQSLLEQYPNLLAGNLIDEIKPRKWLMISREYGIPDDLNAGDRWAIDHLLLDQDGIPTLVEVKRSSDTRIRRQVVGQMLEYAANAVTYWNIEQIKTGYENRCSLLEIDPIDLWHQELEIIDLDYQTYWEKVQTNLQVSKLRLLFVADEIPRELRQIIEFLNDQMNNVEVLAIEIKQYIGQEQTTLIPRIIGQSSKTIRRKGSIEERVQWNENTFLERLQSSEGPQGTTLFNKVKQWINQNGFEHWYGYGNNDGSYYPVIKISNESISPFALWTHGKIELQFGRMKKWPMFREEPDRISIREKLVETFNIQLSNTNINGYPKFDMSTLYSEHLVEKFLDFWMNILSQMN